MAFFEIFASTAVAASAVTQFLTWVREKYGNKIHEQLKIELDKFNWHTAQAKYRDKIIKDFGSVRLVGSDEKISLDSIFTDVYLLKESDAFEYHKRLDNRLTVFDTEKLTRFEGVEFVKKTPKNLYILGKPGAGKTTFLKHIAVQTANNVINKTPIFIYLRDWARTPNVELFEFIVKEFDICGFPEANYLIEYLLEKGEFIILLDGLDEVPEADETRRNIISYIKNFTRKYSENQFLMTCRIASIDYSFDDFTYLRMADFTPEQIENYVDNWFKGKSGHKLKLFKQGLFDNKNDRFFKMASQPLLLSLLCVSFNQTMTFSESRIEIYEEAISYLLHKWNAFNDVVRDEKFKLTKERKMQMFSEIAAQNTGKAQDYDRFPKRLLENQLTAFLAKLPNMPAKEDIDGEEIITNIESTNGILIQRYKNIYSFGHLSFQEYFTARYVRDNNRLEWLLQPANLTDDKWREIILNTAALVSDADDFFEIFYRSINNIIIRNRNLVDLLKETNQKAANRNSSVHIFRRKSSIQILYVFLMLTADFDLDFDLYRAPHRAHAIEKSLTRMSAHVRDNNPDLDYAITAIVDLCLPNGLNNHEMGFAVARDFAFNYSRELGIDYMLYILSRGFYIFYNKRHTSLNQPNSAVRLEYFLKKLIRLTTDVKEEVLTDNLSKLKGFTEQINNVKYDEIKEILDNCLRHRNIKHDIVFEPTDIEKLTDYFQANQLLLDSLSLASVSDRQAIEDRIFILL